MLCWINQGKFERLLGGADLAVLLVGGIDKYHNLGGIAFQNNVHITAAMVTKAGTNGLSFGHEVRTMDCNKTSL